MRKWRSPTAAALGIFMVLAPTAAHAASELSGKPAAYMTGFYIGTGVIFAALLSGIIKCISIMRRSSTSSVCVISLLLMLIAWLVASGMSFLRVFEWYSASSPFSILGAIASAVLTLGALVTGIVGLATYDSHVLRQGRAQAIWGIVLSSIFLLVFVAGVFAGIADAMKARGLSADSTSASSGGVAASAQTYEKPLLNFSLAPSGGKWTSLKPEVVNPIACLAFRRSYPEAYCIVIAEAAGASENVKTDLVVEIAKSALAGAVKVTHQTEEKQTINGIPFVHLVSTAILPNKSRPLSYEHWITTHNGFSYQLIFWSSSAVEATLTEESRRLVETFRLMDPAKVAVKSGTFVDAQLPLWGYSTHLRDQGWSEWKSQQTRPRLAVTAVSRKGAGLIVAPLRFDTTDVPDLPTLARGLLSTLGFDYPRGQDFRTTPLKLTVGEGLEIIAERELSGHSFRYVMRVMRGRNVAHLLATWVVKSTEEEDLAEARKALDGIDVIPKAMGNQQPEVAKEQLLAQEDVLNQIGLASCDRQDWNAAAMHFRNGFRLTKSNPMLLANYGYAMQHAGKCKEALDYLSPLAVSFPDHRDLRQRIAWLHMEAGDSAKAQKSFLTCIDLGLKEETDLLEWLNMLVKAGSFDAALEAANRYLQLNQSPRAYRWKAEVLAQAGKPREAVEVIEQFAGKEPKEEVNAVVLGEFCNQAGDHARAGAIAEQLIQDGHNSVRTKMILGWSQMGRKWYREARATFEEASKLDPGDQDIKRAISMASASLGQGDNSDIQTPIAPVEMPEAIRKALADAQKSMRPPNDASAAYLLRATGYFFKKGEPMRTTLFRRIHVLNTDGVGFFSTMEFPFDPLSERIFVNRIEVKDASGKVLGASRLADSYVLDRDPKGMATLKKMLHVQVPGLKPGCVVEMEITTEDRSETREFPFTRCAYGHVLPVTCEATFITGDTDAVRGEIKNTKEMRVLKDAGAKSWVLMNPPVIKDEPMMLPPEDFLPMLNLSGPTKDWKTVGLDYLKDIADRLEPDDSVRETASKTLEGISGEKERVAALARHVQKTLTYKAIEFGVRARRPNAACDTLRTRLGDCKDHALALHLLLKASGIPSNLALINGGAHVVPGMPSLDQFNHMIVQVPALGEVGWIDATDKQLLPTSLPPENLWEKEALVLDPKNPHVEKLPGVPAGSASIVTQRNISPDGATSWRVEETVTAGGYYGAWLRASFAGEDSTTRTAHLQHLLDGHLSSRVEEAKFEGVDDPEKPMVVHAIYSVRNAVGKNAGECNAPVPASWEKDYLQIAFVKNRQSSFRFIMPFELTSDVTVQLPAAPKESSLASLHGEGHSNYCDWEMKPSVKSDSSAQKVSLHFHFLAHTGIHGPEDYTQCYESWEQARTAWDARLVWPQAP